jgi:hypothetical protein
VIQLEKKRKTWKGILHNVMVAILSHSCGYTCIAQGLNGKSISIKSSRLSKTALDIRLNRRDRMEKPVT